MKALALAIQIKNSARSLWVIDTDTLLLVKCIFRDTKYMFEGNVGDYLEIDGKFLAHEYPLFLVEDFCFDNSKRIDYRRIIDYKSAAPHSFHNDSVNGRIIKMSKLIELQKNGERIDICSQLTGMGDYEYRIVIHDERWSLFWNDEIKRFSENAPLISEAFRKQKQVYFVMDYEQPSNGAVIESGGILLI